MNDTIRQMLAQDFVRAAFGLTFVAGFATGLLVGWFAGVKASRG